MDKKYKWAVYMGRFQPFHDGHLNVVNKAAELAENIIILVGGADKSRQVKNPWTVDERFAMIYGSVPYDITDNLVIYGMHDHPYNINGWADEVRSIVQKATNGDGPVALIGHHKDASSYYLDLFPDWEFEEVGNYNNIDATRVRDIYFGHPYINILETGIPKGTRKVMKRFLDTKEYSCLVDEYNYIKKYKCMWDKSPFPPTFITVDIAVVQSGHILTIMRGGHPGKGTRALPGGYIDVKETIIDSARRELKEETGIDLNIKEFKARLADVRVFDNPERSQLGRVVTHMHTVIAEDLNLYAQPGDDAAGVLWVPLDKLGEYRHQFSSDHWYMAKHAANVYSHGKWRRMQ